MNAERKAEAVLLFNTLIWGGTFVAIKWGLGELSPMSLVFLRFSTASFLYIPVLLLSFRRGGMPGRTTLVHGLLLGLAMFFGYGLQTAGMAHTTASRSAFITQLLVLFTPLLQFFVEKRPPGKGEVPGILLVTVGMYYLTSPGGGGGPNYGDWLTLLCALSFAFYIVEIDLFTPGHELAPLIFLQMATTALLSGAAMAVGNEGLTLPSTLPGILVLLYLILPGTLLVIYLQNRYQKESTPVRASVIFTMEPVFAALFAFLILDEEQSSRGVLGGVLIVAGILFVSLYRYRKAARN